MTHNTTPNTLTIKRYGQRIKVNETQVNNRISPKNFNFKELSDCSLVYPTLLRSVTEFAFGHRYLMVFKRNGLTILQFDMHDCPVCSSRFFNIGIYLFEADGKIVTYSKWCRRFLLGNCTVMRRYPSGV